MTLNLQGIIIVVLAIVVGVFIGVGLGYLWLQGRIKRQEKRLKAQQKQLEDLEASYVVRLRETTQQLRHDYEAELANTIAHYQDELTAKTVDLQQTYATRLQVLQQGLTSSLTEQAAVAIATTPVATVASTQENGHEANMAEALKAELQTEVAQIRRQYEARLKEATQKLQSTYEQKLAEDATAAKAQLQADYNRRLAAQVEDYEAQFTIRKAELEEEYASRQEVLDQQEALISNIQTGLTPSAIMGTGDETTVTLPPAARPLVTSASEERLADTLTGQDHNPPAPVPEVTQLIDEADATALLEPRSQPLTTHRPETGNNLAGIELSTHPEETAVLSPLTPTNPAPTPIPPKPPTAQETTEDTEEGFDPLDLSDFG